MKIPLLLVSLFVPFAMAAPAAPVDSASKESPILWNTPERAPAPGLVHGSFRSDSMEVEVGYNVWFPPDYKTSGERFPVVYFLHGSGGDENSDAGAFSGLVAELLRQDLIPPVICVFPNGGNRSGYRDHAEQKIMVETMIVKELIPLIDRIYRTRAHRDSRALLGFSMGGAGAVRFAARYPDLFCAAGSWGGAFAGRNNDKLAAEFAPEALAPLTGRFRLMLVVGAQDFVLTGHAPMLQSLITAKFPFAFELLADVEHDPGAYYRRSGETMLRFLTSGFATAPRQR